MLIDSVKQLWSHPVKSMAGEKLNDCIVESLGIPGDRGWALRDETTGEITNGKRIPLLMQCAARYREQPTNAILPHTEIIFPDGTRTTSDCKHVNRRISEVLGKKVTLWPLQPPSNKAHYRRNTRSARIAGRMARIQGFRS